MTRYVVLKHVKGDLDVTVRADGYWQEQDTVEASSAEGAIRKHVSSHDNEQGSFVAVPAKSWAPVVVKVETKAFVRFSEPSERS